MFVVIFTLLCLGKVIMLDVMERDVRTDLTGLCTSSLLKNLPMSSFSASSIFRNDPQFGPQAAMVDAIYELSASRKAWCPDNSVSNQSSEWLQVDFSSMKIVKNIFTLGRDDGNYGEYVANYFFDYQRQDGMTWYRYRDDDRGEIMKGNNDARNPTHQKFKSPLIAKRIRIIPINSVPSRVCLKFILYGCDFSDGVVEYQIPRGDKLMIGSKSISFDDDSYDGSKFSNKTWLQGGMGKLMDNIIPTNSSSQNQMQKFSVVWDQTRQIKEYVELLFRFEMVRRFRFVSLYSTSIPSLDISPFSSITLELSNAKLRSVTVKMTFSQINGKVPLKVNLDNKEANLIKMTVFFKSRWMSLNEILFDSEPIEGTNRKWHIVKPVERTSTITPKRTPDEMPPKLFIPVTLISCFVGALIVVIVIVVICFFWVRQRKRRRYKSKLCDYRSMLMNDTIYPSNMGNINTISGNNHMLYGPMDAHVFSPNSSSTIGLRYIHPSYPPCQDYRPHSITNSNEYEPIDSYWPKPPQQSDSLLQSASMDQLDRPKFLIPANADITNVGVSVYSSTYSSHPYDATIPNPNITFPTCVTQDTLTNIFNIHKSIPLKGLLGSSIFSSHLTPVSPTWIESALSHLLEISPANVIRQKHVSEGEIGYITSGTVDNCEQGVIIAEIKCHDTSVDWKYSFYRQCFATFREDFSNHGNLLPIIGKSTLDSSCPSIIYGYPSQVNVVTFFQKLRQIPKPNDVSFSCNYVSQSSLVYLMKQLADALAFLHDASIVHRDVSARNCSIGDHFHLILSDFAIGLEEFQDDYTTFSPSHSSASKDEVCWTNPVQIPLLWMPWESIILGKFTFKSDIWSFGVTLWEIFTECQLKPYSVTLPISKHDPSVILKNALLIASSHPSSILPNGRTIDQMVYIHDKDSHSDISKHIRDVMHLCWQPNPNVRPNFQTLYSILSELSPDSRYVDEYQTLRHLIS